MEAPSSDVSRDFLGILLISKITPFIATRIDSNRIIDRKDRKYRKTQKAHTENQERGKSSFPKYYVENVD